MSKVISVSEARAVLPEILDRVQAGEEVTITRHGRPAAVMVRPDRLRARRADEALAVADRVAEVVREGRARPLSVMPSVSEASAEALLVDLRASRARR